MDSIRIDEIQGILTYLKSIDWTEPWLIALVVGHSVLIMTTVLTRNQANFQALLFVSLLLLVYFSENINEMAARNWSYFSRQQYFDSKGLFISFLFSIPLLMNCILIVCNWLWTSGALMVKLKRAQLRERVRSESRNSLSESAIKVGKRD